MENKAVGVVGDINERARERMENNASSELRYRIYQWVVKKLIELLDEKPMHIVKAHGRIIL
uniref:Uncharacterized protein n=1 Tax=Ignisphaera aggregans TaxID=334771 RepID=A0A7J2U223_9CREN